jgi:thiol-disulfide isomerase/thioredoxin
MKKTAVIITCLFSSGFLFSQDSLKLSGPKPLPSNYFRNGERFRNFSSRDTGESKINTADLAGKILVLNFWFIDCPPCRSEIPSLNSLAESYKQDSTVVFIAIALDNKSRLKNFLSDHHFGYRMVYSGRNIAAQYGIILYPTGVVVDQKGNVSFHTTGVTSNMTAWIRKTIEELKNSGQ